MKRFLPHALITLALILSACSKARGPQLEGITLEFEDSVQWKQVTNSAAGTETQSETTVNGMKFTLEDGVIRIGENSFAGINAGDTVVIGAGGIVVNGEHRWDLPE